MKPKPLYKMLAIQVAALIIVIAVLVRCGGAASALTSAGIDNYSLSTSSILSGVLRSTQGSGTLALHNNQPKMFDVFRKFLDPIQVAHAATCPGLSGGTCVGKALIIDMRNCSYESNSSDVYYNTYYSILFENSSTCTAVKNGTTKFEDLADHTVTRHFGYVTANDDQNGEQHNFIGVKVTLNGEKTLIATAAYSIFKSGWSEEKGGGVRVRVQNSGGTMTRSITIPGVQFKIYRDKNKNWDSLDSEEFWSYFKNTSNPTANNGDSKFQLASIRDHTVYTKDEDGAITMTKTASGNPTISSGTVYTQYNISHAIGKTEVIEPLVWAKSDCCHPTSGRLKTTFPLKEAGTPLHDTEEVNFLSVECGAFEYTRNGSNAILGQDYVVFKECY